LGKTRGMNAGHGAEDLCTLFMLSPRLLHAGRANLTVNNRMDADRIPGYSVAGVPIIDFLWASPQAQEVHLSIIRNSTCMTRR
jgi:hypothetical protein